MSNLSKLFVILVLFIAIVKLGIDMTLFSMRTDYKDKWIKEINYHYQTQQVKNSEISALDVELKNRGEMIAILRIEKSTLEAERANISARLADTARQLDAANSNLVKIEADVQVLVRQLEVQNAQIKEAADKAEDFRVKLGKSINEKLMAVQELQYARQESERLSKDLADLEDKHVTAMKEKKRLEEVMNNLAGRGIRTDPMTPLKPISGKVNAVSADIGLVIISVGADDGVKEGDEFTVYRGGNFVSKVVIDRVDRKWAAGKVVLAGKVGDPRLADDVSNNILVGGTQQK